MLSYALSCTHGDLSQHTYTLGCVIITGPYCTVCADGFSKSVGGSCVLCAKSGLQPGGIALGAIVLILITAAAGTIYRKHRSAALPQVTVLECASPKRGSIVLQTAFPAIARLQIAVEAVLTTVAGIKGTAFTSISTGATDAAAISESAEFMTLVLEQFALLLVQAGAAYPGLSTKHTKTLNTLIHIEQEALDALAIELKDLSKLIPTDEMIKSTDVTREPVTTSAHKHSFVPAMIITDVATSYETPVRRTLARIQYTVSGILQHDCKIRAVLPVESASGFASLYKITVTFLQVLGSMQSVYR
jgi:hypothetical protein